MPFSVSPSRKIMSLSNRTVSFFSGVSRTLLLLGSRADMVVSEVVLVLFLDSRKMDLEKGVVTDGFPDLNEK